LFDIEILGKEGAAGQEEFWRICEEPVYIINQGSECC
jgi:hypothetical protein